jgi:4a-hydroxytetrahydrobiopterin dehydratase
MPRDTLLPAPELDTFLKSHADWKVVDQQLERTYELPTFPAAITFVQRVAEAAEADEHHPDIDIRYSRVTLRLSTHDAGGLAWRDTKLADTADRISRTLSN